MSNHTKKLHDLHPLRLLPLVLCLAMVAFFIIRGGITVEDILNYAPDNTWLAVVFLLLVYAAKSLSVAFPIIVLQIAAGHLFVPATALAVNILGLAIVLSIPYGIGRFSGSGLAARPLVRYPQIDGLIKNQEGHYLFLSFFLRVIYLLPGDVVSMYFGFCSGALPHHFAGRAAGRFAQSACRHPAGRQRLAGRFACLLGRPRHHRRCFGDLAFGLSAMAKGAEDESIKMIRRITLRKGEPLQERASPYFCFMQIRPLSNRWARPTLLLYTQLPECHGAGGSHIQ